MKASNEIIKRLINNCDKNKKSRKKIKIKRNEMLEEFEREEIERLNKWMENNF